MTSRRDGRTAQLVVAVSPALKAALSVEAWECGETLPDYLRGLLETRGKHARSVGRAGGYGLQGPAKSGGSA
jgi:hypothetical protein